MGKEGFAPMSHRWVGIVQMIVLFSVSHYVHAEAERFALIGKSADDHNFHAAWVGCQQAASRAGDMCDQLSPPGITQPRLQARALRHAFQSRQYRALALSVTNSDLISQALNAATIPMITFDSPLDPKYQDQTLSYVGIDNIEFGRELARIAKHFKPQGGVVCLMSVDHDQNLSERIVGVRDELSGNPQFPVGKRLAGEGGWRESVRSPWDAGDSVQRSLEELDYTLKNIRPDVFISVGHWPIVDPARYRQTLLPYLKEVLSKQVILIHAGGQVDASLQALIDDGLVHGFVSSDFYEIGEISYQMMKSASKGYEIPLYNYTHTQVYLAQ